MVVYKYSHLNFEQLKSKIFFVQDRRKNILVFPGLNGPSPLLSSHSMEYKTILRLLTQRFRDIHIEISVLDR